MGCSCNQDFKDHCNDLKERGIAYKKTNDPQYTSYMPHGYNYRPGWRENEFTVSYGAVPVYQNLEWSRCGEACSKRTGTQCVFDTGVSSDHRKGESEFHGRTIGGRSTCGCGLDCGHNLNDGGTRPCPQRRCVRCGCIMNTCREGYCNCESGVQQRLCARSIVVADTCQTIGTTPGERALRTCYDSAGTKVFGTHEKPALVSTKEDGFQHLDGMDFGYAVCSYPDTSIQKGSEMVQFNIDVQAGLLPNSPAFIDPLMYQFCSMESDSEKCILNYRGIPRRCTNFMEDSESGKICRTWLKNLHINPAAHDPQYNFDAVVGETCRRYPDHEECQCVRRHTDPFFNDIADEHAGNPQCWYLPCRDGIDFGMHYDDAIYVRGKEGCKTFNCRTIFKKIERK